MSSEFTKASACNWRPPSSPRTQYTWRPMALSFSCVLFIFLCPEERQVCSMLHLRTSVLSTTPGRRASGSGRPVISLGICHMEGDSFGSGAQTGTLPPPFFVYQNVHVIKCFTILIFFSPSHPALILKLLILIYKENRENCKTIVLEGLE